MDAVTLVADALHALADRAFEQHMTYFADDLLMEQGFDQPNHRNPIRGKAVYRALIDRLEQLSEWPGLMSFEVLAMPEAASDDLVWVHAVIRHRDPFGGQDDAPVTRSVASDAFFAVRNNKISIMRAIARPNIMRFEAE